MIVVAATNVVVSAAFWPKSEDRRCFTLLAKRKYLLAVTEEILNDWPVPVSPTQPVLRSIEGRGSATG